MARHITSLAPQMAALSDKELAAKTRKFKSRLSPEALQLSKPRVPSAASDLPHAAVTAALSGGSAPAQGQVQADEAGLTPQQAALGTETLDDLLPEAYAVVREAARRVLGMQHYEVQLVRTVLHRTALQSAYTLHRAFGCSNHSKQASNFYIRVPSLAHR